jgi:hypothetical protein
MGVHLAGAIIDPAFAMLVNDPGLYGGVVD